MNYPVEGLHQFGVQAAMRMGVSRQDAENLLKNVLTADMRGVHSHGFSRFGGYLKRMRLGTTSPTAHPTLLRESPSALAFDGNAGLGSTIGIDVMTACIEHARQTGCCVATVKNGSHYGFGGYYAMYAAEQGMIGIAAANAAALVTPFGGAKGMLGTNPLSIAVPGGQGPQFVLDMATSEAAMGKIDLAYREGKQIPDPWALDSEGHRTTDPGRVVGHKGALLPFGGAKGYGLALLIELLCCCLGGSCSSMEVNPAFDHTELPFGAGYFMAAIDVSKFMDLDQFCQRVDSLFADIKACPPAAGFHEVMIPGEIAARKCEASRISGVELPDAVVEEMQEIARQYGISFPDPVA